MDRLTDNEVAALLDSIERGATTLTCLNATPREVWAGNVTYLTAGEYQGWCVVVFDDCGDFDYVDRVESPGGTVLEFPVYPEAENTLSYYRPSADVAKRCYHF